MVYCCAFCARNFDRKDYPVPPYGTYCRKTPDCRRARDAARQRYYAQRKRAAGIDIYAPYRVDKEAVRRERRFSGHAVLTPPAGFPAVDSFTRNDIGNDDEWACFVCGETVPRFPTGPHRLRPTTCYIVPLERGGQHARANVSIIHRGCSVSRAAKLAALGDAATFADFTLP